MNFANLKSKIKAINIQDFKLKKDGDGQQQQISTGVSSEKQHPTNPDSNRSNDNDQNPYNNRNQNTASSGSGQQQLSEESKEGGKPGTPKKQLVTFSVNNMAEFSHELTEKFNENSENIRKLEKENSSLREEATCFKENVDGLKEHVQRLMADYETQTRNYNIAMEQNKKLEQQLTTQALSSSHSEVNIESLTQERDQKIEELQNQIKKLEGQLDHQKQVNNSSGDKALELSNKRIQDQEKRLKEYEDKLYKQDKEYKQYNSLMQKEVAEKESQRQELQQKLQEKSLTIQDYEKQFKDLSSELVRKTENMNKKEKMCDQFQKKLDQLMDEKQSYLDRIEEVELEIKATQMKMCDLNLENDKNSSDYNEKLRLKDIQIEKLNEELKHQKSSLISQQTTVSYFRKKVEELHKQLEDEKSEKVALQTEVRRMEQISSKNSSPRNYQEVQEEIKLEKFLNGIQNVGFNSESKVQIVTEGSPKVKSKKDDSLVMVHLSERRKDIQDKKTHGKKMSQQLKGKEDQLIGSETASMEDMRKLREEYDNLAKEFNLTKAEKIQIESQLEEEKKLTSENTIKINELEVKLKEHEQTISDLEKRREQAKKEIKILNYRLEKLKTGSGSSNNISQSSQSIQPQQVSSIQSNLKNVEEQKRCNTEESGQRPSSIGQTYTGIDKLRKFKKELELLYKDLLKVLFAEKVDQQVAITIERQVNQLIMNANDQIDEIEIRQRIEQKNASMMVNMNEKAKADQPIELKKPVRANSTDFRSNSQQQHQMKSNANPFQQAQNTQQAVGNFPGGFNPYSITQNKSNSSKSGIPPIVPVIKPNQNAQSIQNQHNQGGVGPIRAMHK